jgi:hypothetical protein
MQFNTACGERLIERPESRRGVRHVAPCHGPREIFELTLVPPIFFVHFIIAIPQRPPK